MFRFRPSDFEKVARKYKEFSTLATEQTGILYSVTSLYKSGLYCVG